jgi:hypothetical protein
MTKVEATASSANTNEPLKSYGVYAAVVDGGFSHDRRPKYPPPE